MDILFLSPYCPYPPLGGGKIRIYSIIKSAAERHTVDLISYASQKEMESLPHLKQFCRHVELIPYRPQSFTPGAFFAKLSTLLFRPVPFEEDPDVTARIVKFLSMHTYDLIQIEGPHMVPYCQNISSPPVLLDTIGLGFPWNYRELLYEESTMRVFIKWLKVIRYQRAIGRLFENVLVSSRPDAIRLHTLHPDLQVHLVENGVDCDYFTPDSHGDHEGLIFTGAMDYFPNLDAVRYFCKKIYPLIKRSLPNVKFSIVGRDPPDEIMALQSDSSITVTGYVEDIRPFFCGSAVVVVPMRLGAGTRVKVLEALAMGKAVVSTSIGAEGIRVTDRDNILLADTPEQFATLVVHLTRNSSDRRRVGMAGRRLVEREYAWTVCLRHLEAVYQKVAGSHSGEARK